jgi:sugar O-acyltransferase (sialic acid O-acetyltransferase NeuD family)
MKKREEPIQPIVFLGASNAFFEISELIHDINKERKRFEIIAILDDNSELHGTSLEGVPVVGDLKLAADYEDAKFVFGIGSFRTRIVRSEILKRLNLPDERFATLIHPHSKIYPSAEIGAGSIIHFGSVVGNHTVLEPHVIVTFNSAIGVNCRIERCAMITTNVVVLSNVHIGSCAFIGAGSCISEGVTIGPGAMVGMGSSVFRRVKTGAFVLGNPAKSVSRIEVPAELKKGWEK